MSKIVLLAASMVACQPTLLPHPPGPGAPATEPRPTTTPGTTEPDPTPTEPSEAEPVDDAAIVEAIFPADLGCGEATTASVTVRNTGTTTWTKADGYKLGAVADQDDLVEGDVRVWLSDDDVVPPGTDLPFVVPLVAPDQDGTYATDWQMVREGVQWFGEVTLAEVTVTCNRAPDPLPGEQLPLPDLSWLVEEVADENPDLLAASCLDYGGSWEFLDLVVDRMREIDTRWGYNWKRGVIGDASEDVVDYHWGAGADEGSTEVYIIDIIVGHCGPSPQPGWLDVTQATLDGGTIGMWTGRGRF